MNITEVINDIKFTLGLNTIALPFQDSTENVIAEIMKTSIRTFSRFKPLIKEGYEERKLLRSPSEEAKKNCIYYLPGSLTTTPVQYADAYPQSAITQDGEVTTNSFTVGSPFVGFGSYYPQDILNATNTGAAINKYAGITGSVPTSKWLGYNKIQFFNFPENIIVRFVVKCDHDLSGETIPESCVESFMELAMLDVQRTLYNQLKNMNNVGSAFKEINLKIDDWSNAESSRKELVEKWTNTFHYDDLDLVQFF
jgi:hypothetical protein